ncbi:hypothetical protein [Streptomyces sioyaensis]|uniref:hypothetical protein n=1 Tax=Streptomyces sioyaensis TaxID=67364 RepID=UPI003792E4B8
MKARGEERLTRYLVKIGTLADRPPPGATKLPGTSWRAGRQAPAAVDAWPAAGGTTSRRPPTTAPPASCRSPGVAEHEGTQELLWAVQMLDEGHSPARHFKGTDAGGRGHPHAARQLGCCCLGVDLVEVLGDEAGEAETMTSPLPSRSAAPTLNGQAPQANSF